MTRPQFSLKTLLWAIFVAALIVSADLAGFFDPRFLLAVATVLMAVFCIAVYFEKPRS